MNKLEWSQSDYAIGFDFIAQNEERAKASTLLDAGSGVSVALPTGLPLYGMGLYSTFILAPILLFILIVAYFLIIFLFYFWIRLCVGSFQSVEQIFFLLYNYSISLHEPVLLKKLSGHDVVLVVYLHVVHLVVELHLENFMLAPLICARTGEG